MKKYKCELCQDTGWYGDNGPGIKGNREYVRCECVTIGNFMKLKYIGTIECKPCPNSPGMWEITKGTELVPAGQVMRLEYIRKNFTAADCEALNLMDPDRDERLCPPIIGG